MIAGFCYLGVKIPEPLSSSVRNSKQLIPQNSDDIIL